jgi:signal transduction histidine kinase
MMADLHKVSVSVKKLEKDVEVYSDYDLVLRVLTNLVSNAIKHSDEEMEGKSKVTLTLKDDGDSLKFEVLDSGHGVPEGFQKLLFEKYTQMKRVKGSTGLGLTFSKLAVETLQGQIASKNIKDHGALFYFSIPKRHKQKDSMEDKADLEQWEFN